MIKTYQTGRKAVLAASCGLCLLLIPAFGFAIDAPGNTRGSVIADGTVRWEWDWVPGAERYDVIINNEFVATTRDPNYTSQNLPQGSYELMVKAIDSNWNYSGVSGAYRLNVSGSSNNSAVASTNSNNAGSTAAGFSAPADPRGTQTGLGAVQWEWSQVPGANQYEVTVDGAVKGTVNGTSYSSQNLWAGEHSMTIRAVDGNNNYSGRSATAKIDVPSWYDSNNPARSYTVGEAEPTQLASNTVSNNTNTGSTNPAPPPPQPAANDNGLIDPVTWTKQGLLGGEWQLTFSDEFDGNALNQSRWHGQLRWDGEWNGERYEYRVINAESQIYSNPISPDGEHLNLLVPQHNPFQFNGSHLAIRAVRNPLRENDLGIDHGPLRDVARQQPFISGAITTFDKFHQKYGRFEASIRIPNQDGTFPAFWLYHQKRRWEGTQRTEIDIMENLGHAPHFIYNSFHYHTNVSPSYSGDANFLKPSPSGQVFTGTDYSQNFHTYAVEWSPGYVAWFIDDTKVSELWNEQVNYEELYLILNLAMGGNWANFPVSAGGLGRSPDQRYPTQNDINNFGNPALEIDYVRVYRRN